MDDLFNVLRVRALIVLTCAFACGGFTSALALAPFIFG